VAMKSQGLRPRSPSAPTRRRLRAAASSERASRRSLSSNALHDASAAAARATAPAPPRAATRVIARTFE
jgi:hypothetical protein